MGYNTRYTLTQERNPIDETRFAMLIEADEEADFCLNRGRIVTGSSKNSGKWYEHEKSLCTFSDQYPHTLFKLHGEGEDSGDVWDKYFVGGKLAHEVRMPKELPVPNFDDLVSERTVSTHRTSPGPFRISGYAGEHDEAGASIVDAAGNLVATTNSTFWRGSLDAWAAYYGNASLLAASYDLLAAAKKVVEDYYSNSRVNWVPLEAAIMKAEESK